MASDDRKGKRSVWLREGHDEMIVSSDLAMVYGGQAVIDKYRDANLLPHGPGRSKILITCDVDRRVPRPC